MNDKPYKWDIPPEDMARVLTGTPDHSAYVRAVAEMRKSVQAAETTLGGPVYIHNQNTIHHENGGITIVYEFRRVPSPVKQPDFFEHTE